MWGSGNGLGLFGFFLGWGWIWDRVLCVRKQHPIDPPGPERFLVESANSCKRGFRLSGYFHKKQRQVLVGGDPESVQYKNMASVKVDGLLSSDLDSQRTQTPYVTGNSVIGIKYKDGILMTADMGGSYGSTLRYKSVDRVKSIGKHSLLGASGEISDFQEILRYLDELIVYDNMWDDGNSLGPKEVHNYLTRVMYNRRNKFDPLWNSLVLGGVKNGQKYLGMVSMIGVHYEDNHVATGFGNHMAIPILRDEWKEDMSFEEAVKLLEKCMLVLLYRDRSAINKFQMAKITEEGVTIYQPYSLKTSWALSAFQNPSQGAEGTW